MVSKFRVNLSLVEYSVTCEQKSVSKYNHIDVINIFLHVNEKNEIVNFIFHISLSSGSNEQSKFTAKFRNQVFSAKASYHNSEWDLE